MNKKIIIAVFLTACINNQITPAISLKGVTAAIAVKIAGGFVIGAGKTVFNHFYTRFIFSRGMDQMSREANARMAGSRVPVAQPLLNTPIPIAEGTLPDVIRDRIERLQRGDHSWPTHKPVLICGPPGTGKTEAAKKLAQDAGLPFFYAAAPGFVGALQNSGPENLCAVFKNARRRSTLAGITHTFRRIGAWILRRPAPVRKPSVFLLDEIDAFAQPVRDRAGLLPGDRALEDERGKTLRRLLWEVSRNPHNDEHLIFDRCPPADFLEKYVGAYAQTCIAAMEQGAAAAARGVHIDLGLPEHPAELAVACALEPERVLRRHFAAEEIRQFEQGLHGVRWLYKFEIMYIKLKLRLLKWLLFKDKTDSLLIATTNKRPDQLDPRMRDFFEIVEVRPFNQEQRLAVLQFHAQGKPLAEDGILDAFAGRTEGFTGDELAAIVRDGALLAAEADAEVITNDDLENAFNVIAEMRATRQRNAAERERVAAQQAERRERRAAAVR